MFGLALALAVLGLVPATAADESGMGLSGSGLLTLPDTTTLPPGRVRLGLAVDNRDRDPLGIDVFDLDAVWAVGLRPRLETYGRAVLSRVVSLPEPPALTPPPVDLVVLPGAVLPARPYYAIYAPSPYVDKRGSADLSAWVPGDLTLGFKARLLDAGPRRPAIAAFAELRLPLTRDAGDLDSGAGTGGVDVRGGVVARKDHGPWGLVATAGLTHVGQPTAGDRALHVGEDGAVRTESLPLSLRDRLDAGLGLRRRLSTRFALVGEVSAEWEIGAGTPTLDRTWPLDVLAGFQIALGPTRAVLALRQHRHAAPSGERRRAPLAGLVDLTDVDPTTRAAWLSSIGAAAATSTLQPDRHVVVVGPTAGASLPEGARVIPDDYVVRSEHQIGFVVLWTLAF